MTMTETPKEECNAFTKLFKSFGSNHGETPDGTPGDATPKLPTGKVSFNLEHVFCPFETADDLEQGLAAEAVLAKHARSPARPRESFRRCCIFHVNDRPDEYHLLAEKGDTILTAKFIRKEHRLEFYLADEDKRIPKSPISELKRSIPAFAMTHSENNDNWVLTQTCCEHCLQRPKHLSCEFLGKAQQIAFIQHSRRKVGPAGEALVHFVDVRIPPTSVDDTESKVWCPVALGRDLCDRSPHHLNSKSLPSWTPKGSPCRRLPSSSFNDFLTEEGVEKEPLQVCTKVPMWDEELESLVLNFKDRTVQSSPMNFMLCVDPNASQHLVMQHAKLSENTYCLDFRHPLSPAQAFAIALTALLWH